MHSLHFVTLRLVFVTFSVLVTVTVSRLPASGNEGDNDGDGDGEGEDDDFLFRNSSFLLAFLHLWEGDSLFFLFVWTSIFFFSVKSSENEMDEVLKVKEKDCMPLFCNAWQKPMHMARVASGSTVVGLSMSVTSSEFEHYLER